MSGRETELAWMCGRETELAWRCGRGTEFAWRCLREALRCEKEAWMGTWRCSRAAKPAEYCSHFVDDVSTCMYVCMYTSK